MLAFLTVLALIAIGALVFFKIREDKRYGNQRYCYKCMRLMDATHCTSCGNVPTNPFRGFHKIKDHPV